MCYLNQPVAIFMSDGESKVSITPYISAPLSDEGKGAAIELCKDSDVTTPEGFFIWHLDKLNKHTLI